MKKTIHLLFLLLTSVMMFNACSTDVDLYADYKEITVVYGLLDADKDTNFIKINKAFLGPGNALKIAKIEDSCIYPQGQIQAKIIEYRGTASGNNYTPVKEFQLNSMYIHDKDTGIFYAPDQLVYYTKEKIHTNTKQNRYRYELQIDRGDSILNATTDIVGGEGFSIASGILNFAKDGKVLWYPCPNATVYEVLIKFHFTEVGPTNDSVHRCMTWSLGTFTEASPNLYIEKEKFFVNYKGSMFFTNLASFLGKDTLNTKVNRYIGDNPLEISIAAGGEELYNFISVNGPSSSIVQSIPEYSNIKGGYGVFSSRTLLEKRIKMGTSQADLMNKYPNWRFKQG